MPVENLSRHLVTVYLHKFCLCVLGCSVDDILEDNEEGIVMERFICMDMAGVDELGDLLIGHGEQAELTVNVFFHIGPRRLGSINKLLLFIIYWI